MKFIIIGLGNPGSEYKNTYHNVGHMFVDFLSNPQKRFKKAGPFAYQDSEEYTLVKTAVYMNESGAAVKAALRRLALTPNAIFIVVHDDSDLLVGKYKFSAGGGAAGHKGVESVMQALGYSNFKRLRIGIRPGIKGVATGTKPRLKAGDFVLRNISKSDRVALRSVFQGLKRSVIEKMA